MPEAEKYHTRKMRAWAGDEKFDIYGAGFARGLLIRAVYKIR
jgi:hypothetical protein